MAPDTGNMEVLERYGTAEQKRMWLEPLLAGEIRSAFAMTEPGVASSDATNICSTIRREGDEYVIDGHKWYISGAIRPECKVFIFLGRSSDTGPIHQRFSMILVPRDAEGVRILRPMAIFGHVRRPPSEMTSESAAPIPQRVRGKEPARPHAQQQSRDMQTCHMTCTCACTCTCHVHVHVTCP
eukprot:3445293-Prymnesium_polylepis.2